MECDSFDWRVTKAIVDWNRGGLANLANEWKIKEGVIFQAEQKQIGNVQGPKAVILGVGELVKTVVPRGQQE